MDMDKVINELVEHIESALAIDSDYVDCVRTDLLQTVVGLLKEQEIVPVKEDKINKCECGETVCRYWHPKFCGFCGRELLWY